MYFEKKKMKTKQNCPHPQIKPPAYVEGIIVSQQADSKVFHFLSELDPLCWGCGGRGLSSRGCRGWGAASGSDRWALLPLCGHLGGEKHRTPSLGTAAVDRPFHQARPEPRCLPVFPQPHSAQCCLPGCLAMCPAPWVIIMEVRDT